MGLPGVSKNKILIGLITSYNSICNCFFCWSFERWSSEELHDKGNIDWYLDISVKNSFFRRNFTHNTNDNNLFIKESKKRLIERILVFWLPCLDVPYPFAEVLREWTEVNLKQSDSKDDTQEASWWEVQVWRASMVWHSYCFPIIYTHIYIYIQ